MLRDFSRRDGVFGGVAGGLAHSLDVPVFAVRLALFISFFMSFGISLICYIAAVFAFPLHVFQVKYGDSPKVLGVCYKLAPKTGLPASWLRFITLLATFFTGFFPVLALYLITHLILNETRDEQQSRPFSNGNFRDVN